MSELRPGDIVTDEDGSRWRIVSVCSNGVSRVRVGSLADRVMFGDDTSTGETEAA